MAGRFSTACSEAVRFGDAAAGFGLSQSDSAKRRRWIYSAGGSRDGIHGNCCGLSPDFVLLLFFLVFFFIFSFLLFLLFLNRTPSLFSREIKPGQRTPVAPILFEPSLAFGLFNEAIQKLKFQLTPLRCERRIWQGSARGARAGLVPAVLFLRMRPTKKAHNTTWDDMDSPLKGHAQRTYAKSGELLFLDSLFRKKTQNSQTQQKQTFFLILANLQRFEGPAVDASSHRQAEKSCLDSLGNE